MANQPPTLTSLSTSLTAQSLPTPHQTFLLTILTPTSQTKPLAVLTATARHRLLSANLTSPNLLSSTTSSLPSLLSNVRTISSVLPTDVFVQVLDILDIGTSKWSQIELLESERKGETTKGREVIRALPVGDGDGGRENDRGSSAATQQIQGPASAANSIPKLSSGPHKVLLQDVKGMKIWGFELKKVDKIAMGGMAGGGMSIGCKMWLKRGCKVARGVVLLEPSTCNVLGGKIEDLDKAWRKGREQRLRDEVARNRDAAVEE